MRIGEDLAAVIDIDAAVVGVVTGLVIETGIENVGVIETTETAAIVREMTESVAGAGVTKIPTIRTKTDIKEGEMM